MIRSMLIGIDMKTISITELRSSSYRYPVLETHSWGGGIGGSKSVFVKKCFCQKLFLSYISFGYIFRICLLFCSCIKITTLIPAGSEDADSVDSREERFKRDPLARFCWLEFCRVFASGERIEFVEAVLDDFEKREKMENERLEEEKQLEEEEKVRLEREKFEKMVRKYEEGINRLLEMAEDSKVGDGRGMVVNMEAEE